MNKAFKALCCLGIMMNAAVAKELTEQMSSTVMPARSQAVVKESNLHPAVSHESWYLSGLVENEQAERFAYYFVVDRVKDQFTYFTQLISMQTGLPIYKSTESSSISLATRHGINFKIGDGFLRYNEISDSWLFGVDSKEGFNMRVESAPMKTLKTKHLKKVSFYILQSKRVNGQLTQDNKSQFVTSSNAWVAHQWQNPGDEKTIMVERLLCRFLDNQGVMMVRAQKGADVIYSNADLLDSYGESHPVSQFSFISQTTEKLWQVKLVAPKKKFDIQTEQPFKVTQDNTGTDYYLGLVKENNQKSNIGSCMIIKEYNAHKDQAK